MNRHTDWIFQIRICINLIVFWINLIVVYINLRRFRINLIVALINLMRLCIYRIQIFAHSGLLISIRALHGF